MLTVGVALVLLAGLTPWLRRVGFGRLPGDLHFTRHGRRYDMPFASTLVLSAALSLIVWILR